jgi:hypothetical protein
VFRIALFVKKYGIVIKSSSCVGSSLGLDVARRSASRSSVIGWELSLISTHVRESVSRESELSCFFVSFLTNASIGLCRELSYWLS